MPSAECFCVVCKKKTTMNNICGHLMTHKNDLTPYIQESSYDTFATVKGDVEGVSHEYYCCFGCKKNHKSKSAMRDHMKASDECLQKHLDFLRDVGYAHTKLMEVIELRQEIRTCKRENARLKEVLEDERSDKTGAARIEYLEKMNFIGEQYIKRIEEHLRYVPSYMIRPEIHQYCQQFIQNYKNICAKSMAGQMQADLRKEYVSIIQRTPELQFYFLPSYDFIVEKRYHSNGEYQTVFGDYFNRLDYKPHDTPSRDYGHLPCFPPVPSDNEINRQSSKFM